MNALTNAGESALGDARRYNHPEVLEFLRSLGAVDDGIADDEEEVDDDNIEEEEEQEDDNDVENGDEDE